jgi:pimeloyl-ACP methyl ester carboxylesterase
VEFHGLRALMFAEPQSATARALFPDGRADFDREMMRYKAMRFASRIGFQPPYFYNRKLRDRLHRYRNPALVVWGERDSMVPPDHARAYADALPKAKLQIIAGAGHSPQIEAAERTAQLLTRFLGPAKPAAKARRTARARTRGSARPSRRGR